VPAYREIASGVTALCALAAVHEASPPGVPVLPAPAARLPAAPDYWQAREALRAAGLDFAAARLARDPAQAAASARDLGFPVALKALGVLHKSDAGAVALGLEDEAAVAAAAADMQARLGDAGLVVERMAPVASGVEVLVGCRRDPRFGPILLVGLGGVYAEVLRDVRTALAPVDAAAAEGLLRELAGAPLLTGARGLPALDVVAAARAAAALSHFAAAHPEVAEVEINPLLVLREGVVGLDARIVTLPAAGADEEDEDD
jgi:succinyl-CoA synthetase beta subunit